MLGIVIVLLHDTFEFLIHRRPVQAQVPTDGLLWRLWSVCVRVQTRDRFIRQSLRATWSLFFGGRVSSSTSPIEKTHRSMHLRAFLTSTRAPGTRARPIINPTLIRHFGLNFQRNSAPREIHSFISSSPRLRAHPHRARAPRTRASTPRRIDSPTTSSSRSSSSYLSSFRPFDLFPLPQKRGARNQIPRPPTSLSLSRCARARSPTDERGRFRDAPFAVVRPTLARACDATKRSRLRRVVPLRAFV